MIYQQQITCLSTNNNYNFLAGGSWEVIYLWRLKPHYELIKFDGHDGWITSVFLSKNTQYLVSIGEDNVVNVWDVQRRLLIWKNSQGRDEINTVLITDDNKLIIGGSDKTIKILDIPTQKIEKVLRGHSKAVTCLVMSPDERLLFSGSSDTTIKVWDLKKQECIYDFKEHRTEVTCLSVNFIEKKLILVSGSSDGTIKILEVNKDIKKDNFLDRFNILKFNYKLIRAYSDFPHSIKSISCGNNQSIGVNLKNQIKYWSYHINLSGILAEIENVNDILISQCQNYAICATNKGLKLVDLSSREITPLINLKSLIICNNGNQIIETKNSSQFYLQATTLTDDQFNIDSLYLDWQTDGGEINNQGLFTAGEKEGSFNVKVKDKFGLIELLFPIKIVKIPSYLDRLEFSDFCEILELKQEFQCTVKAFDQYDKFFRVENIQWVASQGQIDNSGRFLVDNFIGNVKVKAIARDVKNNRDIIVEKTIEVIEPTKLNQLIVSPSDKNNTFYLQPGEEKEFFITGLDQYNNPIETGKLSWQIESIHETFLKNPINENSRILMIPKNFKGKLQLIINAIKKDINLTINIEVPAILQQLSIEPSQNLVLKPDEIQKFSVKGFDQCGDLISTDRVEWFASNDQIEKDGKFKADYINHEIQVSASLDNVICSVFIKILPVLNSLKIQPQISKLPINSEQQFTVQGYDQFGDLFPLNNVSWQSSHNLITSSGYFTARNETINDQITILADGKSYSFELRVYEPSYLTSLLIFPERITLLPDESQRFQVLAKDQLDREIKLDEVNWSVEKGTFKEEHDNNQEIIYQSLVNQKGSDYVRVTGIYQGVTQRAEVNISIPAVLRYIAIYPPEISLLPDEKYQFTVVGIDQSNNRIDIDFERFPIQWQSSWGGSISGLGIFKGGYSKREVTVTATVNGRSAVARVTLRPTLKKLTIHPKSVSLKPDQSQQFVIKGFDQYGETFEVRNITWEATGGTITQSGFFTANHNAKGEFSVTAIASDYPLLSETYRTIFYALGLSGHFGSFLLSFNEDFVNQLIARILKSILTENNTGSQSKILNDDSSNISSERLEQSDEIFDLDDPFLQWTSAKLNRLIARFLKKAGNLCLELAYANINVSAKIEIAGVPRSLRVYPSTRQINEGEKFKLTVEILDQYQSDYLTVELRDTGLYEWQEEGQLKTIGGKFNKNGILILNDSSREVTEVEVTFNISVETSENYMLKDSTRIKVRKILVQKPIFQELEKITSETAKEDNSLDENNDSNDNSNNLNNNDYLPILYSITIEPSYITYLKIKEDENCQFIVNGFDKFGKKIEIDNHVHWQTSCGNIIASGSFSTQANFVIEKDLLNQIKNITIKASVNGCDAEAIIFIENSEKLYLNRFEFTKLVAIRARRYQYQDQYYDHSQNYKRINKAIYELKNEVETNIDLSDYD